MEAKFTDPVSVIADCERVARRQSAERYPTACDRKRHAVAVGRVSYRRAARCRHRVIVISQINRAIGQRRSRAVGSYRQRGIIRLVNFAVDRVSI